MRKQRIKRIEVNQSRVSYVLNFKKGDCVVLNERKHVVVDVGWGIVTLVEVINGRTEFL